MNAKIEIQMKWGARASRPQFSTSRRKHSITPSASHWLRHCLARSSRRDADCCDRDGRAPHLQPRCPERGQPCPRETKSRHSRTKLSALLFVVATITTASVLLLCPASAHAQGGVPLWTNVISGASGGDAFALAVDSNGNVFVGGPAIIKYSGAGTPLWTNLAHNIGLIAVDKNGNPFATDYWFDGTNHSVLVAYSSAGVPLWTNSVVGSALAVDGSGNVFVTGLATIKYSNAGVPLWTNRYDGVARLDRAVGIAVDSSGNVFVTGISSEEPIDDINVWDFATVAYSNAGAPLWTNRYDGPAGSGDEARAIAVDATGNVFVTGWSSDSIKQDYTTIAYSNSGVPLWTNRYNPDSLSFLPRAIAVDSSGNVFVTGIRRRSRTQAPASSCGLDFTQRGVITPPPLRWTARATCS